MSWHRTENRNEPFLSHRPIIRFFVSGKENEVSTDSDLWKLSLLGKDVPAGGIKSKVDQDLPTVGQYLLSAKLFLQKDHYHLLITALTACLQKTVEIRQIECIEFNLEKHGAYYHPICVRVDLNQGASCSFVLNGAVSEPGNKLIRKEHELLLNLRRKNPLWLPAVFGAGDVADSRGRKISFLLGQWFDGFNEFHLTDDNKEEQVVIWKENGSLEYIPQQAVFSAYEKIAGILTRYFDVQTFEQISPWHQAAGDFIIKRNAEDYDVRLITVRGYQNCSPFSASGPDRKELIWPAVLFFFLDMSLRVRLDRINGTGRPALLDEAVIPFIVKGFLNQAVSHFGSEDTDAFKARFARFLLSFSLDQILEIMGNLLVAFPPAAAERQLIQKNIQAHFEKIILSFKDA